MPPRVSLLKTIDKTSSVEGTYTLKNGSRVRKYQQMSNLAGKLCYRTKVAGAQDLPLFVLCLPNEACDYDSLLDDILEIIANETAQAQQKYRLLVFCAAGKNRPSWPWLIQAFSRIDKKYKKALQKLYLVHEKSWVRVCMQLLENVVSPKFARKIKHVKSLADLHKLLGTTMANISIPREVQEYDDLIAEDERPSKRSPISSTRTERTSEKRTHDPPAVPAPRSVSRPMKTPTKADAKLAESIHLPVIPPRRTTSHQSRRDDLSDCIIFEDPEDESAAAELAATRLEALLAGNKMSTTTQRSTSAPTVIREDKPRRPKSQSDSTKPAGPAATLRRAISGPLTPSSAVRQNFIPTDPQMPPPKIKIHGKEVTIKTRTAKVSRSEGKVGGLAALFEERALVAQSLR